MKEIFALLMAYPLWVKVTIVVLLAVGALLLVIFRPPTTLETTKPEESKVVISIGTNSGGIVAGRDVVIQTPSTNLRTDELIRILDRRAQKIASDLSPHFKYASTQGFFTEFQRLHTAHVAALRRNNLIEAHEILRQIQEVSRALEADEFWTRHRRETPSLLYSLSPEAFQKGLLIEWYVGEPLLETLIHEKMQSSLTSSAPVPTNEAYEDFYAKLADSSGK